MEFGLLSGRKWGVAAVVSGILLGLFCLISWSNGYQSTINPFVGIVLFAGAVACYLRSRFTLWIFGLALLLYFFVALGDYNRALPEYQEISSILIQTLVMAPPLLFAYLDQRRSALGTT